MAMSGVGKARGVLIQEWWHLWHCWPVEMVGAGDAGQGSSARTSPQEGSWGVCAAAVVAPITDGSFLFFFQMSPGTECLGRTFPGKLGK